MTDNAYSFLPWLRAGIATNIGKTPTAHQRATVPVTLVLSADPVDGVAKVEPRNVEKDVQLYGPGDVIGIDPRAVSRTEPQAWITAFEPNYLAHIEFYDEDFPWRYSPAAQDADHRVTPWLALIVLAAGNAPQHGTPAAGEEFAEGDQPGPLPYITVADPAGTLQPPAELGAWAHVHVNGPLADSVAVDLNDFGQGPALDNLAAVLAANADNACSRIICPRHLKPDTTYHAFLVPAFESGRLSGLGEQIPDGLSATQASWGPGTTTRAGQLPYYYRWFFGTGDAGDFDHLVRLLKPSVADDTIARRDIDVHYSSGFLLPPIDDKATKGILKLGGALQPDRPRDAWDVWDRPFPHPFQSALAKLINLADDYLIQPPSAAHASALPAGTLPTPADPIITPPLYGRWPALNSRLLTDRDGTNLVPDPDHAPWVQKLNLDPRYRMAANFGEQIFQAHQEEFMTAAWEQVGDVVQANAKIRAAQLQREVGRRLNEKHIAQPAATLTPEASGRALTVTGPVHPRVTRDDLTDPEQQLAVGYQVATSQVRAAPVSAAMRKAARPGSRLMKGLNFTDPQQRHLLLERLDTRPADGGVTAAARKIRPDSVVTAAWVTDQVTALSAGATPPPQPAPPLPGAPVPPSPTPTLGININFRISTDVNALPPDPANPADGDSQDGKNFKQALDKLYDGWQGSFAAGPTTAPPALGLNGATKQTLTKLSSDATVPTSVSGAVDVPSRLGGPTDTVAEVMAYPRIDTPMYEPLRDASIEEFVPNLGLIPHNTITLLLTDHAFIESYMVGLNHAMARELLWREYPTDQRGTPFRQFWDTHTVLSLPGESDDARRQRLYDITPIDQWHDANGHFTELGRNNNRPIDASRDPGDPLQNENLVLVIRGELLKKYPTAAVFAQKAAWEKHEDNSPDYSQKRTLVDPDDPKSPQPAVKMPIYGAKVEPDLYLLGFDLTEDEARGFVLDENGNVTSVVEDGSGWFFVLKERPGDPRFGAEDDQLADLTLWDDISWSDVDPAPAQGFVEVHQGSPDIKLAAQPLDDANPDQRREDLAMPDWSGSLSSADIAYILFRVPVLMAVHAQEMLPHDRRPQ